MNRLQLAIDQVVFARNYTITLLDQTPMSDWFRMPSGGVSHVAWQVGHLAFAEYRMSPWRIRGQQPQDDAFFPPDFVRIFGANSTPSADAAVYPAPSEIRSVMDRVHEHALQELASLNEAELDQPVLHFHPLAK